MVGLQRIRSGLLTRPGNLGWTSEVPSRSSGDVARARKNLSLTRKRPTLKSALPISECGLFALARMRARNSRARLHLGDASKLELEARLIPSTLYECFRLARLQITEENLEALANNNRIDLVNFHFGLGMFIRNQWLYPDESMLGQKFFAIGVIHPDDMSSIIVEALWLDLNGHEINPSTLRELVGWSERSRSDQNEEDARLLYLLGTAIS